MDDVDLDMLLDSVDVDSMATPADTELDMDGLLDDVADSLLGDGAACPSYAADQFCDQEDELDLGSHQQAMAAKEWESAIARVPPDIRDRWSRIFTNDSIDSAPRSRFRASDCYSGQSHAKVKVQPKQLLQDCVRTALKKTNMSDTQTREILASLVSDHDRYDALVLLFQKEILQAHMPEVKSDPNYIVNGESYQNLRAYSTAEKLSGP